MPEKRQLEFGNGYSQASLMSTIGDKRRDPTVPSYD